MDRPDETLIPPETPWLRDPGAQAVFHALQAGGAGVWFVGGCVRNALLGLPGSDVDIATDAEPQAVMDLARAAGLKAVPTGFDHGTVTVVAGGEGYEVTTLRRDVETDGRRAVVAFTADIAEDARRRDFTINALYATGDGRVLDPLGGMADLRARRVRFIEDAGMRIREDYLRILRFFRFHVWYADADLGFDPDALDAIARNVDGISTLSAERIGTEMAKLLAAPDPAPALAVMRATGVLAAVLPGSDDRLIGPLAHLEKLLGRKPDWVLRLAALGGGDAGERLRLSRADARKLDILRDSMSRENLCEVSYRKGAAIASGALLLRAAAEGRVPDRAELARLSEAEEKVFPVSARDLMPGLSGKALGDRLSELEAVWIASDFSMSRDDLLRLA